MNKIIDDVADLRRILRESDSIAIVGLSAAWHRPSHFAAKYLQDHGYRIYPVNPGEERILGEKCYPKIEDIPDPVSVVNCFRKPKHAPDIARQAVTAGAKTLWLQIGIISPEAARIADEGGLKVVMDRCMKIEHGRLFGGLNWVGVNTGIISARRRQDAQRHG